jgi:hypothetical protein
MNNRLKNSHWHSPPDWVVLELNAATLDQALEQGFRANPDFEAMGQQIRQQVAAGMKFMGIEKAGVRSGFAANVNLMRDSLAAGTSLENAVDEILGQLNTMSSVEKPIARESVTLKAAKGERLRYTLSMKKPDGQPARAAIIQSVLAPGKDLYVLTCTTSAYQVERYQQTFETIAQSFRLLE